MGILSITILSVQAKERSSANSGAPSRQARLAVEVTDQPSLYIDAWDVVGGFEAKVSIIEENHIGYPDLLHSQINSEYRVPVSTEPLRYFRKQTITSTWSADYVSEFPTTLQGQMNVIIEKDALSNDVVSFGMWDQTEVTHYRDVTGTDMYGGKVYGEDVYTRTTVSQGSQATLGNALGNKTILFLEGSKTMNSGKPGSVDEVTGLSFSATPYWQAYLLGPTFWGADRVFRKGTGVGPLFGASPPGEWTATKAVFGSVGKGISEPIGVPLTINSAAFSYTLELSEEDTLEQIQTRLQADRQAAVFDGIPWGVERSVAHGGNQVTDRDSLTDESELWLYNYTNEATTAGHVTESRVQFRFNVPAELRIPGMVYRGRVIQYFYSDADSCTAKVIKVHELEMKEGQWESAVITPVIPSEDGLTVLQYFSMVAEPVPSHALIALPSADPSTDIAPPEYSSRKPVFSSQDLVAPGCGTRSVIVDSLTLQQINLSDTWGVLDDWPEVAVTWSSLSGATAQVRIWHWHNDGSPLGQWSLVSNAENLASYFGSTKDYFFAELLGAGRVTVRISFNLDGQEFHDDIEIESGIGELAVDANRDGEIHLASKDDSDATSTSTPYRFWINDDDDTGPVEGNDIPGQASGTADYSNAVVDSVRDLVDFFPVYLDIKQLLTVLPPSASIKYKLKQADGALNFVYTNQNRAQALDYQKPKLPPLGNGPLTSGFGPQFIQAPGLATTTPIPVAGVELSSSFLDLIRNNDGGVLLIEARSATDTPLMLTVEKEGAIIAEIKLELKISKVEDMYRRLNLRDKNGSPPPGLEGDFSRRDADVGKPTYMGKADGSGPEGYPDSLTNGRWFVFVIGSNVGGEKMRAWQSESFKRLYWSGMKARFVGVSWYGDPYSDDNDKVYDYHVAVRNAFSTAPMLAAEINKLPGSKTVAGHSLGCGVVASAVVDHGMSVTNAVMLDAALAQEVYDGDAVNDLAGMVPEFWQNYPERLWSARWNERFVGTSDSRRLLTWRNRFLNALPVLHNFYSSTEEVLARYEGTALAGLVSGAFDGRLGAYAWVIQEKTKGNKLDILGLAHAGSDYAGWGYNTTDPLSPDDPDYYTGVYVDNLQGHGMTYRRQLESPSALGSPSDELLRRAPVFDPGWGILQGGVNRNVDTSVHRGPDWINDLYSIAEGNGVAANYSKRSQLLAEAIPALSVPVGIRPLQAINAAKNYDLPSLFADQANWPRPLSGSTGVREWRHSDMREVAYSFQTRFYDQLKAFSDN